MTAAATSGSSFGFPDSFNSLTLAPCDAICAVNSASDIFMLICGRDYLVSEDDDGTRIEATADTAFCASLRAC